MNRGQPLLSVRGLNAWYGESHALHGVDLDIWPGETITLLGRNGVGKTTTLRAIMGIIRKRTGTITLDGKDIMRVPLHRIAYAGLGFVPEDRAENIRRVGEVAALFADAGMIAITAFISPYRSDRERAREAAGRGFHEIYVKADLATCESRDPKGLYAKARSGEIKDFTGISAPYEAPETPELVIDTASTPLEECLAELVGYVEAKFRV